MSGGVPEIHRIYIEESILGVFGVNEAGDIVERTMYPMDSKQIVAALSRQLNGELTKEVRQTIEKLIQRGFNRFVLSNRGLAEAVERRWGVEVESGARTGADVNIREKIEALAVELGAVKDISELHSLSHEVSVLMARRAIRSSLSKRETVINQTVNLLVELDKMLNILSIRLREWYGLHFPELSRLLKDHRTYAKTIDALGDRVNFEPASLIGLGIPKVEAEKLCNASRGSMGALIEPGDLEYVRQLAAHLDSLYAYRQTLEDYISTLTPDVAPNLSEVAGPVLAARLIEKAGGLRKMSMMPSSTIQLLGAEKALFRALKSKSKPPKHGLIFQHPVVHSSPRRMRGRAARSLAAKLAIAARVDAFSGKFIGARLRSELDSKMERVRKEKGSK